MSSITLNEIKNNEKIKSYIKVADDHLDEIGFTEHGFRHAGLIAKISGEILRLLGYPERIIELGEIAGYLHDIGNLINRNDHAQNSAIIAQNLLEELKMPYNEIAKVIGAIGNHDENHGSPVNEVAAALIIADKSDAHYKRVRNKDFSTFDIHDRVNYAVKKSSVEVDADKKEITLSLRIDLEVSTVMEYFEIFLTRMMMCRKAANYLGSKFRLVINDTDLL
ncbi:HD domain-containing protein [Halonatronum saccharophilum]|uniref:HD domain-containing protein n=1 Tax=Halonatronum saccharophilum TaxID=150060 RepID=UPI000488B605|nr:HD domain-containing protein [Halonatronum saccharophilum]